jgi:hypothetical protein
MLKTLIAAAISIPINPLCHPVLAGQITSPKPTASVMAFGSGLSAEDPPSLALGYDNVTSNIACRNKARSKFFELGARDMSPPESNAQWATVGNMRAVAWCRENHVVIGVSGHSYNSVNELRDLIRKAF